MWKYQPVLNAIIKVLLTIGFGGIMGFFGIFDADEFVKLSVKFVFFVALPCLVVKGIGIGVDFYSDAFLWKYIAAFLILRIIALICSFMTIIIINWWNRAKQVNNKGLGDITVIWLSLTWISTVIMGIPISEAVFQSKPKGAFYGLLAGISSFIFQLPLQLVFLECHALDQDQTSTTNIQFCNIEAGSEADTLETGMQGEYETSLNEKCTKKKWWVLGGKRFVCSYEVWRKIILRIVRNPVLLGILSGFVISLSTLGPRFLRPTSNEFIEGFAWIDATLEWFGKCVSPVSLFAMGMWMQNQGIKYLFASIFSPTIAMFMIAKMLLTPFIMIFIAEGVGLNDEVGRAAVLIAVLPISLASFSLGHQFNIGEEVLSANVFGGMLFMLPAILCWNIVMDEIGIFPIRL